MAAAGALRRTGVVERRLCGYCNGMVERRHRAVLRQCREREVRKRERFWRYILWDMLLIVEAEGGRKVEKNKDLLSVT